jgi:WD40 repeat protein
VKAHTETVKVLEFIEEESILMTSSFDRRVNIWNAITGEYIDSLQQNYNKTPPEPLAFYDLKKNYLYTKDRKRAFENVALDGTQLDFDPFLIKTLTKSREDYFETTKSNKEWNLQVNFLDVVQEEKDEFEKVMEEVSKFAPLSSQSSQEELNLLLMKKMEIIDRKRKLMKDIRN